MDLLRSERGESLQAGVLRISVCRYRPHPLNVQGLCREKGATGGGVKSLRGCPFFSGIVPGQGPLLDLIEVGEIPITLVQELLDKVGISTT